jgi:hypothetical protein
LGYHTALFKNNHVIDFVHPKEITKCILANYKVLIIPFPYCLNKSICTEIKSWVKNGGTLIGEAYFAAWNMEHGHHEKIVPGYGFDKVFKARQKFVEPSELFEIPIIINKDLAYIHKDEIIHGTIVKESLVAEGAEVIASFDNGEPAITVSEFGKGKAVLIGSYIGLPSIANMNQGNCNIINSLVEYTSDIKRFSSDHGKIRTDILTSGEDAMVIIQNLTTQQQSGSIALPLKNITSIKEQFDESIIKISISGKQSMVTLNLEPKEVKVFRV